MPLDHSSHSDLTIHAGGPTRTILSPPPPPPASLVELTREHAASASSTVLGEEVDAIGMRFGTQPSFFSAYVQEAGGTYAGCRRRARATATNKAILL